MLPSSDETRDQSRLRQLAVRLLAVLLPLLGVVSITGAPAWSASLSAGRDQPAATTTGVIAAIGAENEYGNVIAQIGGDAVSVTSILDNPNTDPHTFESSPSVAREVGGADLVVQNGLGYDDFMNRIEAASPNAQRKVISVQSLLGLPDSTPNPHLWYSPTTMPAVALAVATDLATLEPARASYFAANLRKFDQSLLALRSAIVEFAAQHAGKPVGVTEPVADYLLSALGLDIRTPYSMQADVMNGIDPSPEDITTEDRLFSTHQVKVFVYNEQVVDSLTASFRTDALHNGIPVVGVFETMPTPGYTYQSWMLKTISALSAAITDRAKKTST